MFARAARTFSVKVATTTTTNTTRAPVQALGRSIARRGIFVDELAKLDKRLQQREKRMLETGQLSPDDIAEFEDGFVFNQAKETALLQTGAVRRLDRVIDGSRGPIDTDEEAWERLAKDRDATIGLSSGIPASELTRTVYIEKDIPDVETWDEDQKMKWKMRVMSEYQWYGDLMGWRFGNDAWSGSCELGIEDLRFDSASETLHYCKKMGFNYYLPGQDFMQDHEEMNDLHAEKLYEDNFVRPHIKKKQETTSPEQLMNTQFKHPDGGKSAWVNLKHTDYGATESKMVSQTHWKDVTTEHDTKSWTNVDPVRDMEKEFYNKTR